MQFNTLKTHTKAELLSYYYNFEKMEWQGKHTGTNYLSMIFPDQEHCLIYHDYEGNGEYQLIDVIYTVKRMEELKKLVAGK